MDELTGLLLAARDGDGDGDEDVTQDVYVRAWRALPAFRHDATARTWLLAIARRACVDTLRRRTRRLRLTERLDARPARDPNPDPGAAHVLEDLVDRLDADRRDAFMLTRLLGCSYEEAAAAVCAVPVGTIRSRVARARADLLEQLRDAAAS